MTREATRPLGNVPEMKYHYELTRLRLGLGQLLIDDTSITEKVKNERAVAQNRCLKRLNFV